MTLEVVLSAIQVALSVSVLVAIVFAAQSQRRLNVIVQQRLDRLEAQLDALERVRELSRPFR